MLLGLHTTTFRELGPKRAAWFVDRAAQAGLRGVQFAAADLPQDDLTALYALRAQAEERGLLLEVHGAGLQAEPLALMIRSAHALGARVLSLALGLARPADPDQFEAQLRAAAAELRAAAVKARRYGLWLAVENNQDLTSGELLRFLGAVGDDQVGVCFDAGNPLAVMEDPVVAAQALGPHALSVHLKDYRVAPAEKGVSLVSCPCGEGEVNVAALLKEIFECNPAAHVAIESPTEKIAVPCLEEDFLQRFTDRAPQHLAAMLRLARAAADGVGAMTCEERFQRSAAAAKQIVGEVSLPLEM